MTSADTRPGRVAAIYTCSLDLTCPSWLSFRHSHLIQRDLAIRTRSMSMDEVRWPGSSQLIAHSLTWLHQSNCGARSAGIRISQSHTEDM
jgi:hypothetical protein